MVSPLTIPKRIVDISVGLPSGAARSFKEFYCAFEVKSYARSKPNTAKVQIYNCSESTIRYLEGPNLVLTVNAGETVAGQLFQGAISKDGVVTKNSGPDWITTIDAADGRRAYRDAIFSQFYPPGVSHDVVLADIAKAMGKPLVIAAPLPARVFPIGVGFHQKARSAMDEIVGAIGYNWAVISGTLYVFDPAKPLPGNAPLITPESGLRGSPERTKQGVKLRCNLNPAIIAGKGMVLKSRLLSGTYRVEEVGHKGNFWGTTWETAAQGKKV